MMPILPFFKRGDTFAFACVYKVDSVPTSVTDFIIQSHILTTGRQLVTVLTPVVLDQTATPGAFNLIASDTSNWPIGRHICDIQITQGDVTRSSVTFVLPVMEGVTS